MTPSRLFLACLLAAACTAVPVLTLAAASSNPTATMLPDSATLARVNDRAITVRDFCNAYYASPHDVRPNADSLGRVEYLNTLITKEVLGLTALAVNRPLDFGDRNEVREFRDLTLANVLYQRMVEDSVRVTEQDIRDAHKQFGYDVRVRSLVFGDRVTAEHVRHDLIAGRTSWDKAAKDAAIRSEPPAWLQRKDVPTAQALVLFAPRPGSFSDVVVAGDGCRLYQVLDRRPVDIPDYTGLRRYLWIQLRDAHAYPYVERLNDRLRKRMHVRYDTTNIVHAASKMGDTRGVKPGPEGAVVEMAATLPELTREERESVLVRWDDGELTLDQLLSAYMGRSPFFRSSINTFETMRVQIDTMIFGPAMTRLAEELGFEADSLTRFVMAKKREEIAVMHLYQDSIMSKVNVTPEAMHAFYDVHRAEFKSFARAVWAGIPRSSQPEAMAVLKRLRAGTDPATILREDSLAGRPVGSIRDQAENDNVPYKQAVFEELKPGESTLIGPHSDGSYAVVKLISRTPRQQLSFDDVRSLVATSVQNTQSESLLHDFVARHAKDFEIVARPDHVMSFDLRDVSSEVRVDD
jgi:PPIC-type PPIASE domain